ncbi:MAG: hypothetical protein KKC46_06565 [Proteobacteria bacterium]|nr:hypothetical protein [Pseudomonadota bacterium]
MNNEYELIEKNIELSAEFSRYLFEHPELSSRIPPDSELVLVPEFDIELREFNLSLGKKIESEGVKVTYIIIRNIHPKTYSRLTDVELKIATTC